MGRRHKFSFIWVGLFSRYKNNRKKAERERELAFDWDWSLFGGGHLVETERERKLAFDWDWSLFGGGHLVGLIFLKNCIFLPDKINYQVKVV